MLMRYHRGIGVGHLAQGGFKVSARPQGHPAVLDSQADHAMVVDDNAGHGPPTTSDGLASDSARDELEEELEEEEPHSDGESSTSQSGSEALGGISDESEGESDYGDNHSAYGSCEYDD